MFSEELSQCRKSERHQALTSHERADFQKYIVGIKVLRQLHAKYYSISDAHAKEIIAGVPYRSDILAVKM